MRVKLSRPYMHCCTRSIHSPAQNETQAFASIVFSWSARALMFHSRGGCLHEARKLLLNTLDANLANESLSYHEYASMLRKFDKHFKYELERL